ncbi:MAG: family 43 glycosylhydrolase [Candidatus Symbiothrix sp.]|nr:family 43 glycosylhydrolase [Candidatus Symbiothrix sp.]
MKKLFVLIFIFGCGICSAQIPKENIVANPMNLNYRFQFDEPSRREAADPVCEYFKGKYYLFASKTGGCWSSEDLKSWYYIPYSTLTTQENYAPTIMVWGDRMYYLIGGSPRIFYTDNPDADDWKELNTKFNQGTADPAFFKDEDTGKVYIFWGCSDKDPIMGAEVDPNDGFKIIGYPKTLIEHNGDKYGWEVPGANNNENRTGWNEGPCMIKHNGKYYLQYAAPGTEYRIYADGIYVGDNPLGPFTYADYNPFSIKPGGFAGAAGHGHTFKDKYGNYWHVASMKISVRHAFERRLGLFPVYFTEDGKMFCNTVWSDYPFAIPDEKTDFENHDISMNWNLLSFNKPVSASSNMDTYIPKNAVNEQIESWWTAQTGNAGEWLQVDLEKQTNVHAIQVNFADQDFSVLANPTSYVYYQYKIEKSDNGTDWTLLIDKTQNTADAPHELIVLDEAVKTHYLRIVNTKTMNGKFSLSGFRIFGLTDYAGDLPEAISQITVKRNQSDTRRIQLVWKKRDNADGYIVRWGVKENQLNNATMVYSNNFNAGYFNRDSKYYFSIDAFNENGITRGTVVVSDNFSSINELKTKTLSVYPNPSDGIFNVELSHTGWLNLSDLYGRKLYACYSEKNTSIDTSNYAKGCYILSFVSEHQNDNIKLIKK